MKEKNNLKEWVEKEKEYEDLFEDFLNSDEKTTFSKHDVEKIIEAHLYKEVIGNFQQRASERRKQRNLLVTTKKIGLRLFNIHSLFSFFITYLFYIGFLLMINEFIYSNLYVNKTFVFIIGFVFTLIDKLIKPFVFIADLVSFTIHKIGLLTLLIFTIILYFVGYSLGENISLEKSFLVSLIVLICIAVIDYLKKDSLFKTKYVDDDFIQNGSDEFE